MSSGYFLVLSHAAKKRPYLSFILSARKHKYGNKSTQGSLTALDQFKLSTAEEKGKMHTELPLLHIDIIAVATDNFLEANKLGEGGFGPVYKVNCRGMNIVS